MTALLPSSCRRFITAAVRAAAACVLLVQSVQAQSKPFRLSGVISDADETPLEGVRVELIDTTTQATTGASTDQRGRFELKVPAGQYRTRVSYRELEITSEEGMDVSAGSAMTLDLSLYVNQRAGAPFCFSAACVDRLPGIEPSQDR